MSTLGQQMALDNANAIDAEVSELLGLPPTHAGILSAALLKARLTDLALDEAQALINSMQITAADIRDRAVSGEIRQLRSSKPMGRPSTY